MSVINKMLRDLDQRANVPSVSSASQPPARSTIRVTPDVAASSGGVGRRHGYPLAVFAGLLLGLTVVGIGWWVGLRGSAKTLPEVRIVSVSVPALIQAAVGQPVQPVQPVQPAQIAQPVQPAQLAQAGPILGLAESNRPGTATVTGAMSAASATNCARGLPASVPSVPTVVPLAGVARDSVALGAEGRLASVPATKIPQAQLQQGVERLAPPVLANPVASTPAAPGVAVPVSADAFAAAAPAQQWQGAAVQALAQAQQLWNAGLTDAATSLLAESLLMLERVHGVELPGSGSPVALSLVRELVRMELAQGQPDVALALLKRHDKMVIGQADLLASRGSAAQRVGQHAQASQSYQAALKLRPREPRWMLGAAISLAAMGEVAAAAELVEQARGLDAIKPDILAYLKQLGVPLRER
ncbi:MAG: hypothetical protein H7274_03715 [Rhodoferax sp.]|nr:hypothetical protein [Rhodoferax sp.]